MKNGKLMKHVKALLNVRLLCNVTGQIAILPLEKCMEAWKWVETWQNFQSDCLNIYFTQNVSDTYSYHSYFFVLCCLNLLWLCKVFNVLYSCITLHLVKIVIKSDASQYQIVYIELCESCYVKERESTKNLMK